MKCKVVFLGAAGTGKTSIINRYITDDFDKDYNTTVGIDFFTKPVQVQDRTINLQIWATAGQERFKSLIPSYIRESKVAVIVYDVSNPDTFEEAKTWQKTVMNERGNDAVYIFAGNKNDLESKVDTEQVNEYMKKNGITLIETSAKTGEGITRLFKSVSESMHDSPSQNAPETAMVIDQPKVEENSNGSSCC